MKYLLIIGVLLLLPHYMEAQSYVGSSNWCQQGGHFVKTSGLSSSTYVQQSYPQCTVTVFQHGTSTKPSLYQSDVGSPPPTLANPFTANTDGSYLWYVAAASNCYDVQISGTSIPTVTTYDVCPGFNGNAGAVTSVFGRTGGVLAQTGDYTVSQVTGAAPLSGPTFTGVPTAPTAGFGTNTTQVATTAFVQSALPAVNVTSVFGRTGSVTAQSGDYAIAQVTGGAPLASPTFTGSPAAPSASFGDNTTRIATDAFVQAAISGISSPPVTSIFGRTGAVTAQTGDYGVAQVTGAAASASPAFTGTPTAPTAGTGTSTTQLATTAFVGNSIAAIQGPNLAFNSQSSATNTNISAVPMIASTSAMHDYLFAWEISLTTIGTGCSGSTTVVINALFTDPNNSSPVTDALGTVTIASSGNGTLGFVASGLVNILAAASTAVQYSTSSYSAGSGCSVNPTYQVSPTLIALW
jgi:hypothetical protein